MLNLPPPSLRICPTLPRYASLGVVHVVPFRDAMTFFISAFLVSLRSHLSPANPVFEVDQRPEPSRASHLTSEARQLGPRLYIGFTNDAHAMERPDPTQPPQGRRGFTIHHTPEYVAGTDLSPPLEAEPWQPGPQAPAQQRFRAPVRHQQGRRDAVEHLDQIDVPVRVQ